MRVIRNVGHVKRRKRAARISAIVGFVALASTFGLVFVPAQFIIVAYGLLLVGFLLFNMGMQQIGKWTHNERHVREDFALDGKLSGMSDKYVMLHFMKIGKVTIEHMLIHPGGVLVITTRDLHGKVSGKGDKWRKAGMGLGRIFGMSGPQLGNPSFDTTRALTALDAHLEANQLEVETAGAIVFTSPAIDLDADESDYPALPLGDLPGLVADLAPDPTLTQQERDRLVELLTVGEEIEKVERPKGYKRPVKVKKRVAPVKAKDE